MQTHGIAVTDRFATLLGDRRRGSEIYDQPLLETDSWVVAPTLGAIVPNWLIALPRHASLNFKSWQQATGHNPAEIVARVCAHLDLSVEQVLWFEHGPRDVGTVVGCGIDYAHLHILFDLDFTLDALERFSTVMDR